MKSIFTICFVSLIGVIFLFLGYLDSGIEGIIFVIVGWLIVIFLGTRKSL